MSYSELLSKRNRGHHLIKLVIGSISKLCIGLAIVLAEPCSAGAASDDSAQQLQNYLSRSQQLLQQGKLDEAQRVLGEGVTAFKKMGRGDSLEGLELQLNLGAVFYQKGNLDEALKRFDYVRITRQKTLGIAHEHTRMAYQNVTATFLELKKPDKAIEILRAFVAASAAPPGPYIENEIWALDWIKEIQQRQKNYQGAILTSEELQALCLKANPDASDNRYLSYVLNASAIYGILGELSKARDILEKNLETAHPNAQNIRTLTNFDVNLGLLSIKENRYASAVTALREAIRKLDSMNELASEEGLNALLTLGEVYIDLQDANAAETLADKVIEIISTAKGLPQDNPNFSRAYAILGSVLALRGDGVAATSALEFAFQKHAEGLSTADLQYLRSGYALLDTYLRFGLSTQAIEFSNTIDHQTGFERNNPAAAPLLARICAAQRLANNAQKALEACKTAATLVASADQTTLEALRVSLELSLTYFELGRFRDASTVATKSLSTGLSAKSDRFQFSSEMRAITEVGLRAAARLGPEKNGFSNTLFQSLEVLLAGRDVDKVARVQYLRQSIKEDSARVLALHREYLQSRLERADGRLQSLSLSSKEFKDKGTSKTIVKALQSEIADVQGQLEADDRQGAIVLGRHEFQEPVIGLADLQAELSQDEAVLIYAVFQRQSVVILIRRSECLVHEIAADNEQLKNLVKKTRSGLNSFPQPKDRIGPLDGFDTTAAAKLYELIWKPVESSLSGTQQIYIVPDGPLSALAFPALLTNGITGPVRTPDDIRRLPFLVKAPYAIALLPNVKFLLGHKDQASRAPYFVGIGNPIVPSCARALNELLADAASDAIDPGSIGCALKALPAAGSELDRVSERFKFDQKTVLQGADATEANLRALSAQGLLRRATLILIATHGLAPGELQIFTDPMHLAADDHIGIPTVGDIADAEIRRHTDIPPDKLQELRGMLVYSWYKRDVPDTRYTFPPGLILTVPDNAISSGIINAANDGFLSSSEIAELDIGADLVILSACNTAATESDGSSAIFTGLSQSFLAAGAKSLIVTQWSVVSDAAAAMTARLTESMASQSYGGGGSQALHRVMNDMLEHGEDPHPFVWAPFTFVGGNAASTY